MAASIGTAAVAAPPPCWAVIAEAVAVTVVVSSITVAVLRAAAAEDGACQGALRQSPIGKALDEAFRTRAHWREFVKLARALPKPRLQL